MKALIISVTLATIGIIVLATMLNPPKAEDIVVPEQQVVKAGEGEVCSTPSFTIPCISGLECRSIDGELDFDENKQTGYCQ